MFKLCTIWLAVTATAVMATPKDDHGALQAYCLMVVNFPDLHTPDLTECLRDATTDKYEGMVCLRSRLGTCVDRQWLVRRVSGFVTAVGKDLAWGEPVSHKFAELPFVIADGEMHSGLGFLSSTSTTTVSSTSSGDQVVIGEIREIDDEIRVDKEREKLEAEERNLETAKAETQGLDIGIKVALYCGGAALNLVVIGICQWCQRRAVKRDFREFKASFNTTPNNNAVLQNIVTQV